MKGGKLDVLDFIVRAVIWITIPIVLTGIYKTLKGIIKKGADEFMAIRKDGKIVYTDDIPVGVSIGMKNGTIIVGVKEIDRPVAVTTEAIPKVI